MYAQKPELLFEADVDRRRYLRRLIWLIFAIAAMIAARLALRETVQEENVDGQILDIGQFIALILAAILAIRAAITLGRFLTTRSEKIRIFDRGFAWQIGKTQHKYSWGQLKTFREGVQTFSIFGRPLVQLGAHTMRMRDGKTFRISARHGDTRAFVRAVRPVIADITGTIMGRALRENRSVQLNKTFTLAPKGIVAGNHKIRWSALDIRVRRGKLAVRELNKKGKFKTVKTFKTRNIDNLAGFLDIAESVIQNHQPDRFDVKTKGMAR